MSTAEELSHMLALSAEQCATALLGEQPSSRSRGEVRFYPKGGLSIETSGPKRGVWCRSCVGRYLCLFVRHSRRYKVEYETT